MKHADAVFLIQEIEKSRKRLWPTEEGLIRTVKGDPRDLSKKQSDWLQEIYRRVYGGGAYEKREIGIGRI